VKGIPLMKTSMKTSTPSILLCVAAFVCLALSRGGYAACSEICDTQSNTAVGNYVFINNPTGTDNAAFGAFALKDLTSGKSNTATGSSALIFNETGSFNTAVGANALAENKVDGNTAVGAFAMVESTSGVENTAVGSDALYGAPGNSASYNTATGFQTLYSVTTGGGNVGDGWQALYSNQSGGYNTGLGVSALRQNTVGNQNTAVGTNALYNGTGSNNVALGFQAGQSVTTGSNNIVIGAGLLGNSTDANVTRIGKTTQKKVFIGGIYGIAEPLASGIKPVYINSTGQLGTTPPASSARFKEAIKPMDRASEGILSLKPVSFRYKDDVEKAPQFGLIAEEVAKVNPELVVRDDNGQIYTVRYDAVNAMLLNEFLKEHRRVQEQACKLAEQDRRITEQQKQIEALTTGLQKVTAQIESGKPAPRIAINNY
jgi:trimeric autotransporter adhesin